MSLKILIHLIAAARPNFMKIAPLYHALKKEVWAAPIIVHTGQHYDLNMSDAFFMDLNLPEPHIHLGVGSGTHAEQTGQVMIAYEKALLEQRPDLVIVVGDVNSTVACALAASKISYESINSSNPTNRERPLIAHLEAGLRSFDRTMPEEINRIVTDSLADILLTPSQDANENLLREGISKDKIRRVGNMMIDSLEMLREKIQGQASYEKFGLDPRDYGLVTLHRPSNVDDQNMLESLCQTLTRIAQNISLIFPVHPRTRKSLEQNGLMSLLNEADDLHTVEPMGYTRFMNLLFNCRFAITDSGGIQEETTYLGIPCLTLRPNTERPITIEQGTNQLCIPEDLESRVESILSGKMGRCAVPELWDGQTASRVVKSIEGLLHAYIVTASYTRNQPNDTMN
ncbi:MAG: UDP-N-acetylglucosamine 2-epimerase (non-hydrolyzing) [Desulfobacterales bacterium]|nr:UDP-N-acetylglucosamine 2-epimerase (non-hydrolyzing) [Desulfobacterales bacterium]